MAFVTPEMLAAAVAVNAIHGSNANGEYLKFSNGVLWQWGTFTHSALGNTGNYAVGTYGWSFYYGNDARTFPLPFVANPTVLASTAGGIGVVQSLTTTGFSAAIYSHVNSAILYHWLAIGRWK